MGQRRGAKRFVIFAAPVLVGAALLTGCAAAGSSEASCAAQAPRMEAAPQRAAPGEPFTLRGENFVGPFLCDDTGAAGSKEISTRAFPARDIRLELRQGRETWELDTVDARRDLGFGARVEVPAEARSGGAVVVAVGEGEPARETFQVLEEPGETALSSGPPRATLSYGEESEAGEPGSYCWSDGCADIPGFSVPPEEDSLAVTTGSGMIFEFGEKTSSVKAEAVSLDSEDVKLNPDSSLLVPKGNEIWPETQDLDVRRSLDRTLVDASLPPGEYALGVFVRVPEGDASYYFRIRVEPEVEREVTGGGGGACGFPGGVQPVN